MTIQADVDFYSDDNWPKIIALLRQYLKAANERMCNAVKIDLHDISESVLGVRATTYISEAEFDALDLPKAVKLANEGTVIRANMAKLRGVISDALSLTEIVEKHGEWVMAEIESPSYILVNINTLKIVDM